MKHIKLFEGFKENQDEIKSLLKKFAYDSKKTELKPSDWYELAKEIAKIKGFEPGPKMKQKLEELVDLLKKSFDGNEFMFDMEEVDDILNGVWTDPAGGKHSEDDDDPAAMYEGNNEQTFPLSANRILNVLSGSTFEKWYKKDFLDFIEGADDKSKTKQQILEDIINMFK